jgi:signal transduction histidine kinase
MFRSATLRLTLWYLAIAMAISILFSFALYNVTTNELMRGLHSESQSLYQQFPVFQNDPNVNFRAAPFYSSSSHRILLKLIGFNIIVLIAAGISSYLLARRTLEPIEAAHTQQKRFTSDVSHELRTPLTAIKMESEVALLSDNIPINELRDTIQSNLEEVGKLENLINNLLRLSLLEVDELQHNFSPVSSELVVDSAIAKVSKTAQNHDIRIVSEVTPADALGDQDSLIQLITNKNSVIWQIKDQGIGIEQKALERVFDRFYRSDNSRTKSGSDGYGLGLSIAKMIADIHKANITLTSQLKQGTIATITIPRTDHKNKSSDTIS